MQLIVDTDQIQLYQGDAADYVDNDVDLVLTHPYTPLPPHLRDKPIILSGFADRKGQMERFAGQSLTEIGRWHRAPNLQAVWVANLDPEPLDLSALMADEFAPCQGWWPLDLPLRLLEHCGFDNRLHHEFSERIVPAPVVWDGFMGRGTAGRACQLLGLRFVGIDIDPARVTLARNYLGV